MASDGDAEVRRVPGSLVKSPPAIDPGGTFRSDPVPDLPESLQRPRAHTRRASANANARATAGEARTRAPLAHDTWFQCQRSSRDSHNPAHRVMPMGRRAGPSIKGFRGIRDLKPADLQGALTQRCSVLPQGRGWST